MEAKKWIQEKSLVKTKTLESDHGPCSLNTTASYDDLRDEGSPVDLTKLYMSSRPPWASPSSFKFGFRTPPSAGSLHFNDKNPSTSHLLASSKSISLYGNGPASHIPIVPDKSEDSPEVRRNNEDSQEDNLQNFLNQEIRVLHHNGEVPVVKECEQAVTAAEDAKAFHPSMSAGSAAPLMELHNHGGHIGLSRAFWPSAIPKEAMMF